MFDKERVTIIECEIIWLKIGEPDFNDRLLFFSNSVRGRRFVGDIKSLKHVREYDWKLNFIKSDKYWRRLICSVR